MRKGGAEGGGARGTESGGVGGSGTGINVPIIFDGLMSCLPFIIMATVRACAYTTGASKLSL